jgi:hypothetical protein
VTAVAEAGPVERLPERVALMVIRAWIEAESDPPALRARLTEIRDLIDRDDEWHVTARADIEEICEEVRRWLTTFEADRSR